jgi:hypothetical protein
MMERNIGTHARRSLDAGQELPKRCDQPFRCYRGTIARGREPVYRSLLSLFLSTTVFLVRMRFSSVSKTWFARESAQWPFADIGDGTTHRSAAPWLARTAPRPRGSPFGRGRKARPCPIGDRELTPALSLFLFKTVYSTRTRFTSARKAGSARERETHLPDAASDLPPPKLECTGAGPPFFTFTAQYLNSGILPTGSSTGLVSLFAAAS